MPKCHLPIVFTGFLAGKSNRCAVMTRQVHRHGLTVILGGRTTTKPTYGTERLAQRLSISYLQLVRACARFTFQPYSGHPRLRIWACYCNPSSPFWYARTRRKPPLRTEQTPLATQFLCSTDKKNRGMEPLEPCQSVRGQRCCEDM